MSLLDTDHLSLLERSNLASLPLQRMLSAYARLLVHLETCKGIPVVPFDEKAVTEFERLRSAHL
jgi:hypothetical protein